ncbi:hypothetical protein HZA73_09025 [candidate division TA06 bacterium]|nr:hypothetical protein [candidate division TA06 bacterium]
MKTLVKLLVLAVLFGTTASILTAQTPVKQDLIKMLEAVPAPPASSKDAFAKTAVTDAEGNITYSAAKLFENTDKQLKDFEDTYTAQAEAAIGANPNGIPAGMPGAGMTEADAKRIQSMTKEQQIAMAMAMAGKMSQPVQMEPPAIKAAQEAWQVLYAQTMEEHQRGVEMQQEEGKLQREYEQAHNELDSLQAIEISKLPQLSTGEMSYADPVLLKAVKMKYADKHIAVADKRLAQIGARWQAEVARIKTRNADFLKKLAACGYAEKARNFSTNKILSDGQMSVMNAMMTQVELSRHAWEESASWQGLKKRITEEKY